MKAGMIIYLVGGQEIPEPFDLRQTCQYLGVFADRVELVGHRQGFFEVDDALFFLLTKGCGWVSLLVAQWEQHHLSPVYPPVRVWG